MGRILVLILVCWASALGQRYEKLAPFDGLRWKGETPEVQVGSTWYEVISIDGVARAEILAFCKKTWSGKWRKRFTEDLVEVLSRMGHKPGEAVDLVLRELPGGPVKTMKDVAMTEARRRALLLQRRAATGRGPSPGQGVSRTGLNKALDRLAWRIENTYSYRDLTGFDWRSALQRMRRPAPGMSSRDHAIRLMKILAQFGDGHTRVGGSASVLGRVYLPVRLEPLGDRIVALRPGGGAAAVQGHPFVKSIDGVPVDQWVDAAMSIVPVGHERFMRRMATERAHFVRFVREELERSFEIKPEVKDARKVTLELTDATGRMVSTVTWPVASRGASSGLSGRQEHRILDGAVGYIRIPRMSSGTRFHEWLHGAMAAVKDTKGLIIDVRGNGGGTRDALRVLFPYFLAEDELPHVGNVGAYRVGPGEAADAPDGYLANRFLWPASHPRWSDPARRAIAHVAATFKPDWKLPAGCFSAWHYMVLERTPETAFHYARPLIILLDTGCFSATDIFLGAFHGRRNVTLMGMRSGGGSGRSRSEVLAGSGLTVRMSSMASFRPNGQRYDGKGIAPDVELSPSLSDLMGTTDSILAAAVERLGQ